METRQQSSSEMIIPVPERLMLHFGKGHVSELNMLLRPSYTVTYVITDIRPMHTGDCTMCIRGGLF